MGSKHGDLKPDNDTITQYNRPVHTSTKRVEGEPAESTHTPQQNQQLHLQELTKSTTAPVTYRHRKTKQKIELDLEATGTETCEIYRGRGQTRTTNRATVNQKEVKLQQRGVSGTT